MNGSFGLNGGVPIRTTPMPTWPATGPEERAAVERVLFSNRINYWTGEECRLFEREYAHAIGRTYAISLANGTLALELALRAFGVGAGDEVVVPARTFIATASAAVAVGAVPIIADIDPLSGNLTAETVAAVLTGKTRAVIPVHVGGWPVDMAPLVEFARRNRLIVIEDCAQAHGATFRSRPVGALGSDAAAFSFCQDKIVPLGEGGMLLLDDRDAFERAWAYKDHGKSLDKVTEAYSSTETTAFRWLVDDFGTNWRMPEIIGAMGRASLEKLPEWHRRRAENATALAAALAGVAGLRVPAPPASVEHGYYRLHGFVEPNALGKGWDRGRVLSAITSLGVPCQYGTCAEIYREPAFAKRGFGPADRLPNASAFHETCIAFFVHPSLGPAEIGDTAAAIRTVMEAATK